MTDGYPSMGPRCEVSLGGGGGPEAGSGGRIYRRISLQLYFTAATFRLLQLSLLPVGQDM